MKTYKIGNGDIVIIDYCYLDKHDRQRFEKGNYYEPKYLPTKLGANMTIRYQYWVNPTNFNMELRSKMIKPLWKIKK